MRKDASHLFINGVVRTCDTRWPEVDWVQVESGVVRAIGCGEPPSVSTPVFDLHGRTLVPGFCDAHVHLTWLATSVMGPDVSQCGNREEVFEAVQMFSSPGRGSAREWIVASGFDESEWADKRLPTRKELDAIQNERPVLLVRACGHVGIVNSMALGDLEPGEHTDTEAGRLAEDDLYALNDLLRPSAEDLAAAWPQVEETLHGHGITAVHDVTPPELVRALRNLDATNRLGLHISSSIPARYVETCTNTRPDPTLRVRGLGEVPVGTAGRSYRVLGIKLFTDGSLGARTAFLREPYADQQEGRGVALYTEQELSRLARDANDAGVQLMVHAIGDAALDLVLDALDPVLRNGNPLRHRFEHVEVTPPDLVARLGGSGARACVQPNFAGRWSVPGGLNEQRLGARLRHCNAYRSLRDAGLRIAFGSDVMPLGPLFGLESAIAHPVVSERLDATTALELYTSAAAEIAHAERRYGRIVPGLEADLAILSQDPGAEGVDWTTLGVESTFVAGRRVFESLGNGSREPSGDGR